MQTRDGAAIPCDLVAVAVGVRPRVELARAAGLPCARGVLVDEYLRAGDPDIYAAGDIAEVADPATGRRVLDVLWNSARRQRDGWPASTWRRSRGTRYAEDEPLNITRLAGLHTTIIGTVGNGERRRPRRGSRAATARSGRSSASRPSWRSSAARRTCALALGERTIDGAVVMGDQTLSFPLQELIEARVDLSAAERVLATPLADVICDVRGDWKACRG